MPPPITPCAANRARQATLRITATPKPAWICSGPSSRERSAALQPLTGSQTLIDPSPSLPPVCTPQGSRRAPRKDLKSAATR